MTVRDTCPMLADFLARRDAKQMYDAFGAKFGAIIRDPVVGPRLERLFIEAEERSRAKTALQVVKPPPAPGGSAIDAAFFNNPLPRVRRYGQGRA